MDELRLKTELAPNQTAAIPEAGAPAGQGSLLLGRFRVHERREGGFAFVYGVRDERAGTWYAVKILKARDAGVAGFESEVSFWLAMDPHPNIVRAFFVRQIEERPALFLEYVGGHALNTVRALLRGGAPLDRRQALAFARQIALAMEFANSQGEVAHLDLKPENLMVSAAGTLKVTDFGLACRVVVVDGRYPMISNGTWPYVAPEWFEGKAVDSRADIYACGVILYEMLTGATPFGLDRRSDLFTQMKKYHESGKLRDLTKGLYWQGLPGFDKSVGEIISTCLQWYPGERFRSFRELGAALDRVLPAWAAAPAAQALTVGEEFERAVSLCRIEKVDEALSLFNRLMIREPHNTELWRRIADVLEAVGETGTAEDIRERL